jgi:hypothetical protein
MPRGVPGPVAKPKRKANKGSFTKERPGPGRPRGVPNKFTGELKEAILAGVNGSNLLGVAGLVLPCTRLPRRRPSWAGSFPSRRWARWTPLLPFVTSMKPRIK